MIPPDRQRVDRGRLVVIAAPSGAGKTTLVHALMARMPDLRFSISYTTRPPRASEHNGVDYFFVSEDEFRAMVSAGAFLEHARVFDHCYGTGREHVEQMLAEGSTVLLEIDWQGARQVRAAAPDAVTVFIVPPSLDDLERRLRGRATDSEQTIARRLADSVDDLSHWDEFDYVIVNDRVERAAEALARVVAGAGDECRTTGPELRARMAAILAG